MPNQLTRIPFYVYGEFRSGREDNLQAAFSYDGRQLLNIALCDEYGISAAIETAHHAQISLSKLPLKSIQRVISKAMNFYMETDRKRELVVALTGSPIAFIRDSICMVIDWCRDLDNFVSRTIIREGICHHSVSPAVLILPSNSEVESLYCLTQFLLARTACIVRPSSRGAGAYMAWEFVQAINRALDEMCEIDLEPLRQAISVVHTESGCYLEQLCVDGWSYIFFGDDRTACTVGEIIRQNCSPRQIIVYGTGLSMTVLTRSCRLERHLSEIMDSITVNTGNECISTDIIYVPRQQYSHLLDVLIQAAVKFRSGDPMNEGTIGLVREQNAAFIAGELDRKGKSKYLSAELVDGRLLVHATVIPLSEYDAAIEYPGPVVSLRSYDDNIHLGRLIKKDLADNGLKRNLVTSVFTDDNGEFEEVLPLLNSYTVKYNMPTHLFNCNERHQGTYLVQELLDVVYLHGVPKTLYQYQATNSSIVEKSHWPPSITDDPATDVSSELVHKRTINEAELFKNML